MSTDCIKIEPRLATSQPLGIALHNQGSYNNYYNSKLETWTWAWAWASAWAWTKSESWKDWFRTREKKLLDILFLRPPPPSYPPPHFFVEYNDLSYKKYKIDWLQEVVVKLVEIGEVVDIREAMWGKRDLAAKGGKGGSTFPSFLPSPRKCRSLSTRTQPCENDKGFEYRLYRGDKMVSTMLPTHMKIPSIGLNGIGGDR
ncbi:hypothetical protein F4703DRAFT_1793931 [Phycomyces blakesleeanus]